MRALSPRLCLSLGLLLSWFGTGCASLSSGVREPEELASSEELASKAKRLCELGLLGWPDVSRFPADMPPQDYVRPEDLAWAQAHPEEAPPAAKPPAQPGLCEVQPPMINADIARVPMRLQGFPAGRGGRNGTLSTSFVRTSAGWRMAYWLAEEASFPGATSVPLFSEPMTRPERLSGPDLSYTREALEKGIEGYMVIRCVITRAGNVINCRTLKSLPLMVQPALQVLGSSRYTPATLDGQPIDVRYTFIYSLHLPRPK